jgi:hypothetical protein
VRKGRRMGRRDVNGEERDGRRKRREEIVG